MIILELAEFAYLFYNCDSYDGSDGPIPWIYGDDYVVLWKTEYSFAQRI